LDQLRQRIDHHLASRLPAAGGDDPGRLAEAMRYAALGPGKRLRPALTIWACEALGGAEADAIGAACAVELVHAYSLVHDDLPCCDNDDERRGRPTCHRVYGQTVALLVGDALLTLAFELLAEEGHRLGRAASLLSAVGALARGAGAGGMVKGQARDLAGGDNGADFARLEQLHREKTGALFQAAAALGAYVAGADDVRVRRLERYGAAIGLAFQHLDDRDDREHEQHAGRAAARTQELLAEASAIAAELGAGAAPLAALAAELNGRVDRPAAA
jgi:geranylgeranyl pyrophosphate synthase